MSISNNINKGENAANNLLNKGVGLIVTPINKVVAAGNTTAGLIENAKSDKTKLVNQAKAAKKKVIDLGNRFQSAFGFVTNNKSTTLAKSKSFNAAIGTSSATIVDGRSSFEEFTMSRPGLKLKFGYTGFVNNDNVFAPPAILSFKSSKRIEETIVTSVDRSGEELAYGQVVELYGSMPINITIKGLLIDMDTHQYPSAKVKQLAELFNYNGIWIVEGQIWGDKGIKTIYIESMEDGGIQGYMDTWQFTLEARSISPIEFGFKK